MIPKDAREVIPKDAREVYLNDKGEPIAFCPKGSIGLVDLHRAEFYRLNATRLSELAQRARVKSVETGVTQCVVCIDVDDPTWTPLVDMLMPGADWNAFRRRGEQPVARGVVPLEPIQAMVNEVYPAASDEFTTSEINVVVFAAGGASVLRPGS